MAFQKLTYSGTICNSYVYFSFDAENFDTGIISRELNINPTSVMIKKDSAPKSTSWKFGIQAGDDVDLESHLEKLLDVFEPYMEKINELKDLLNLETNLQFV